MISVRPGGWPCVLCGKLSKRCDFFRHYKYRVSNFAWWLYSLSFTHLYYFQWPWFYFKVTAVSNDFKWKFYVLIRLSSNYVRLLITSSTSWICHFLFFSVCLLLMLLFVARVQEIHFLVSKKKKKSLFLGHCLSKIFQTLQDYSFTQGLHFHCMFDDLDFVQGHMSARNMNCKLDFLESCLNSCLM